MTLDAVVHLPKFYFRTFEITRYEKLFYHQLSIILYEFLVFFFMNDKNGGMSANGGYFKRVQILFWYHAWHEYIITHVYNFQIDIEVFGIEISMKIKKIFVNLIFFKDLRLKFSRELSIRLKIKKKKTRQRYLKRI